MSINDSSILYAKVIVAVLLSSLLILSLFSILLVKNGNINNGQQRTGILAPAYAQNTPQSGVGGASSSIKATTPFMGVDMRGFNTATVQERTVHPNFPVNYYEDSFRAISQAGMNLVRYLFFWESYEKNPATFIAELDNVSKVADKWGIKVIYANDQYRTSSWLDPAAGYGFPSSLFQSNPGAYKKGGGGGPTDAAAKKWWTDWFNRSVKGANGVDGWTLQADFLKKIVSVVNNHPSTLGYELLNEPRVYSADQWIKVGNYNSFLTNSLRKVTPQKIIVFDRQASPDLGGPIAITPQNMAKMAPTNKAGVIFKATLFGVPGVDNDATERFNAYVRTAQIARVQICFCEFNIKEYNSKSPGGGSLIDQNKANIFVQNFKKANVWGWAFWIWDFNLRTNPNFNLVGFKGGNMQPSKNFDYVKTAIANNK